ncbi:L-histidine N(alpha)-methyltransferase [Rhodothermaceae bacterium RA]|nr:L-histidine N(alpha)-methyltransferase [Rhodothermaceae bacterium RA]
MLAPDETVTLYDFEPRVDTFREAVIAGLSQSPRSIPAKFFYDARGSQLFEQITELEAYYPTRTEIAILEAHMAAIVERIGPRALLVEYGSGSSRKTRLLLDHLIDPAGYVPIDISRKHLLASARALARRFPDLPILAVCADYMDDVPLPHPEGPVNRIVAFFPGSTIGNLEPDDAVAFLRHVAGVVGPGGGLLIGVDLQKDTRVLERAYNDEHGVTAAFNLNLLARINRELEGTFDLETFRHHAFYNAEQGRIEMHLISRIDQTVCLGDGPCFDLAAGETIRTEYSYKYTLEGFATLAERAGFHVDTVWTDSRAYFSLQFLCP